MLPPVVKTHLKSGVECDCTSYVCLYAIKVLVTDSFMGILFQKMLYMDPSRRITAKTALEHEYFKDIRSAP